MDAGDISDKIKKAVEEEERIERRQQDRFRTRAAVILAVLAMLLAIATLGGANSTKEMTNANIQASDSWAFYQAKDIRQTDNQLAADELESALTVLGTTASPEARQAIQARIDKYRATVARYDSEPDPSGDPLKGEGKKELTVRAQYWEAKRDRAAAQDPNFDYSAALFQIGIVLGSVSIVANSRRILALAVALGVIASLLMINGFFLLVPLP